MCMRRTFVSRSIGPRGGVPGHGMRTIIERAFTAHKPATARYVGGWRRLWAAGLLCALAGTASGYVQASSSSGNFTPVTRAGLRAFRQRGSTTAWRGSSARTDSTSSLTPRWPGARIAPTACWVRDVTSSSSSSSKGFRHARQGGSPCGLIGRWHRAPGSNTYVPTPGAIYAAAIAAGDWHKVIAALTESPNPSQSNDSRRRDECTS